MTPSFRTRTLIAASVLVAAQASHAVTLSAVIDNGNFVSTLFTTTTHVGVDVGFQSTAPAALEFVIDAADVAGSVSFNSILSELTGRGFSNVRLLLTPGASFLPGSVAGIDGSTPSPFLDAMARSAWIPTTPGLAELYVGDALLLGATDWRIGFSGLDVGDAFRITLSPVSEPGSMALVLGGLALAGALRRRR